MLQIRLSKLPSETGVAVRPLPSETVTVACPDHLVLADIPVAKGIGAATPATLVHTVGRRSRRQLGERVHFCVRCDYPINIYGRLSPCEHVFCLDCARSDSICYLCNERIQKIQTIKLMEGIFICASSHCLKTFLKMSDFTSHINDTHADRLHPNAVKEDVNESEVQSAKQSASSDATVRGPSRPLISPGSNSQNLDSDDKVHRQLPLQRPMIPSKQPHFRQTQNFQPDSQPDSIRPPGFDWLAIQNHLQLRQESGKFADKQQGILSEVPNSENPPMHALQPPNFVMAMNANPLTTPQFGIPPIHPEGGQPFYGTPYEMGQMARPDSAPAAGAGQGSLLGFPPGPSIGMNFMANYLQPWNAGAAQGGQIEGDEFGNISDSQGNVTFYQGDCGRNPGVLPMAPRPPGPPSSGNNGMEVAPGSNSMDTRDGRGILAPQAFSHTPPPPQLPFSHSSQSQRSGHFSSDRGHDGQGFGWQHENYDGFGSGQD